MAHQALTPGTTQPRRRALFGLLDANGWAWASVKAFIWFILMIFLLGYIPDRAYYFTVNRTLELGILAWSPVNFCPAENRTLPCPAPIGAVVPWEPNPPEVSLPEPRTDGAVGQVGTRILYVGGSNGTAATDAVFVAPTAGVGNFRSWTQGPSLPEPRTNAAVAFLAGKVYVVGGLGADGAPTRSVYVLAPDSQTGELGEWQAGDAQPVDLTLPEARSGAALVAAPDGLLLVGGTADGTTPLKTVWKSKLDSKGDLTAWVPEANLYQETADAGAAIVGDYLWVLGGTDASGKASRTVQRGEFGVTGAADAGVLVRVGVSGERTDLPEPRTNAAVFTASGALYVVGGADETGTPRSELHWAIPDATGNIPEWKHLVQSDLPAGGLAGSAPLVLGPNAILVGGTTAGGPIAGAARANIAPQEPFFQVGLVGATVPALKIDGEIGQQLGYLNANGAGALNFAILIVVGWAFAHREQVRALRERLRRRRG